MKFEHLIQINDILNPLIEALSREQVWNGLVLRAAEPCLFVPHLDECVVEERSADSMRRRLRYGKLVVRDTVILTKPRQLNYLVEAQGEIRASTLTITIEEPNPDALFVRFAYDDGGDAASDAADEMYNDFKRSAYVEADIDTVRIIRELAQQKRLDAAPDLLN